jgi:hypothetical protein
MKRRKLSLFYCLPIQRSSRVPEVQSLDTGSIPVIPLITNGDNKVLRRGWLVHGHMTLGSKFFLRHDGLWGHSDVT